MTEVMARGKIERNIAMELVRVTEAAALAAARYLGRGDKTLVRRISGICHAVCPGLHPVTES